MTYTRSWTLADELHARALGELMDEYKNEHPCATDTQAFDAVAFEVGKRMNILAGQLIHSGHQKDHSHV